MNLINKEPTIILIAGKARSGKNTTANIFKEKYEKDSKKVILNPYTKYLKMYIEEITSQKYNDDNKPREFLQKLGVELIKEKLGKTNMLINRQIDDIDIYSYYFDVIIIPDVRFENEITNIKNKYNNTYVIKINNNIDNNLTKEQKEHITETSLDNYNNYDFIINNDNNYQDLKNQVEEIYIKIKK